MRTSLFGVLPGVLFALGLVLAVSPPASAGATGALHISTFTDTLPGDTATAFHTLAGDMIRRVYIVRNDGLLPLTDVSVHDPDASPSAIRCGEDGDADDADLGPLSSTACSATFTASAGEHESTVVAMATSPVLERRLSAHDQAGYAAIAPGLSTSVTYRNGVRPGGSLPADTTVSATVTVVNSGAAELTNLRLAPPPQLSGLRCSGSSTISSLSPGESASCTGSLATAPGRHDASLTVAGRWLWDRALTSQGPQPPRSFAVQAVADASYDGISPARSPSPPVRRPTTIPPRRPAALPASSPPTTPSPPKAGPALGPAPQPSHALAQAAGQFVASRGLSFPLKVLAIVVIPGVAAARRIARR